MYSNKLQSGAQNKPEEIEKKKEKKKLSGDQWINMISPER